MDTNYFAVFIKAFVEKFHGRAPTQKQWDLVIEILKEVPTERLSK
jgi:hypothetical protein